MAMAEEAAVEEAVAGAAEAVMEEAVMEEAEEGRVRSPLTARRLHSASWGTSGYSRAAVSAMRFQTFFPA